jgi:hypothetical protein
MSTRLFPLYFPGICYPEKMFFQINAPMAALISLSVASLLYPLMTFLITLFSSRMKNIGTLLTP